MTLNAYLLAQATAAVAVAAPAGLTLGEWLAIISCGLVLAGVVYRSGVASQKAQTVENLVGGVLKELSGKMDKMLEETQRDRLEDVRWKTDITGRVVQLEDGSSVHIHQRAGDVR